MGKNDTVKIIKLHAMKCNSCLDCEKVCSRIHFKTDEGSDKSAIHIEKNNGLYEVNVCNQCGLCLDMCPVGALQREKNGTV